MVEGNSNHSRMSRFIIFVTLKIACGGFDLDKSFSLHCWSSSVRILLLNLYILGFLLRYKVMTSHNQIAEITICRKEKYTRWNNNYHLMFFFCCVGSKNYARFSCFQISSNPRVRPDATLDPFISSRRDERCLFQWFKVRLVFFNRLFDCSSENQTITFGWKFNITETSKKSSLSSLHPLVTTFGLNQRVHEYRIELSMTIVERIHWVKDFLKLSFKATELLSFCELFSWSLLKDTWTKP